MLPSPPCTSRARSPWNRGRLASLLLAADEASDAATAKPGRSPQPAAHRYRPRRAMPAAATHGAHTPLPLRSDAKVGAALLQLGSATEDTVAQEAQTFSALIKGQGLQSLHGAVSPPDS